jgi:quercetin dioxygenase-like cupin family protein
MKHYRWEDVKLEQLSPTISRRMVWGEKSMAARVFLKKGAVVPEHKHDNEQITMILEGALEFQIGGKTLVVRAGDVLVIPGGMPHAAKALEDTDDLDVFCPPRQDWISGNDAYLRGR